jgi:hypothetical protein
MKRQQTGGRSANLAATRCWVLAMLALAPLPGIVLLDAAKAVAADTNNATSADAGKATGAATATRSPEEREAGVRRS